MQRKINKIIQGILMAGIFSWLWTGAVAAAPSPYSDSNILTVFGTVFGSSRHDGHDGVAKEKMKMKFPTGSAFDAAGNFLVIDSHDSVIWKNDHLTNIAKVIAGSGFSGFSGDGGPASQAELSFQAFGLAIDSLGNIYFTDNRNCRIRKIDISGIINTVAGTGERDERSNCISSGDGGAATAANIGSFLEGLAIDQQDNVYFSDGDFHSVRKINVTTGNIERVAGDGSPCSPSTDPCGDGLAATSAQISYPQALVFDSAGNLYISAIGDAKIRRVAASDGTMSTIAGIGGVYAFSGSPVSAEGNAVGGVVAMAYDPAQNILYFDEIISGEVDFVFQDTDFRMSAIDLDTGIKTTYAFGNGTALAGDGGQALAAKEAYFGLSVDATGNVYQSSGYSIRRIDKISGIIDAFVGNNKVGDGGPAMFAHLVDPVSIDFDPLSDRTSLAERLTWGVRSIEPNTPEGTILPDVNVDRFFGFSGNGGPAIDAKGDAIVSIAYVKKPTSPDHGSYYIADSRHSEYNTFPPVNSGIRQVDTSGTITAFETTPSIVPLDMVADPVRNLLYVSEDLFWFADGPGRGIFAVDRTSGVASLLVPATPSEFLFGIDVAADGSALYYTDFNKPFIYKRTLVDDHGDFDPDGATTIIAGNGVFGSSGDGGSALNAKINPFYPVIDPTGRYLLYSEADGFSGDFRFKIRTIDLVTGKIGTDAESQGFAYSGNGGSAMQFSGTFLRDMQFDPDGNLHIVDGFDNDVVWALTKKAEVTVAPPVVNRIVNHSMTIKIKVYGDKGTSIDTSSVRAFCADVAGVQVKEELMHLNGLTTQTVGNEITKMVAPFNRSELQSCANDPKFDHIVVYGKFDNGRYFSGVGGVIFSAPPPVAHAPAGLSKQDFRARGPRGHL